MRRRFLVFLLAVAALEIGCDTTQQQDDFAKDASSPPSGYAETDDGGKIVSDDKDDWRSAPVFAGKIRLDPAYPNPVASNGFLIVPVTTSSFDQAIAAPLIINTQRDGRLVTLDTIEEVESTGFYTFNFSAALFGSGGLHRVYVFDGLGELVSYGDVLVR